MELDLYTYLQMPHEVLSKMVMAHPSLLGIVQGYAAEYFLKIDLLKNPHVSSVEKEKDSDRSKRWDLSTIYKDKLISIELKSLAKDPEVGDGHWQGKVSFKSSDKKEVEFPDESTFDTTLLIKGQFDILAISCFSLMEGWFFLYALNSELPMSTSDKLSEYQRQHLLANPIKLDSRNLGPFTRDFNDVCDRLLKLK